MPYERDNIRRLEPYVPGEQPRADGILKLNTNENPYAPCPAVIDAIRNVSADAIRRYPSETAARFREAAARIHGLIPDQVIATNGGDELLRLAVTVFCEPQGHSGGGGGGMGLTVPTYSLYEVLAGIHDTPVTRVQLDDDWSVPDDFAVRLNDAGCSLAFVVNPHAPSGRLEPIDRLEKISRGFGGVLLIDEAYVDFADGDGLGLVKAGLANVLLLRSLSKGYALAGLRFGYGLGHRDLIAVLDKARDSYNTDVVSQAAATAAIKHREHAASSWQRVREERARVSGALAGRGFTVYPSQSNFILVAPPSTGPGARTIFESLKKRAIFVRYFDEDRLRDTLRITIGTPQQNDALIEGLGPE